MSSRRGTGCKWDNSWGGASEMDKAMMRAHAHDPATISLDLHQRLRSMILSKHQIHLLGVRQNEFRNIFIPHKENSRGHGKGA